jgi:hypothetical protein
MWRAYRSCVNDVSEKRIASIFMVEKSATEEPACAGGCRLTHQSKTMISDFSTLKMEAIYSSETSVHTRSRRLHILEDDILHSYRCEKFKSYLLVLCWKLSTVHHLRRLV